MFCCGIISWGVSELGLVVKKRYVDKMKCEKCKQEAETDYRWRLSQLLRRASGSLGLNKPTQRISVYKHENEIGQFVMIGRYSCNPVYNKDGRMYYPGNEGVICEAWKTGEKVFEIFSNPENLEEYCNEQCRESNIPQEVSNKFAMKSVYYSAHAVSDIRGNRIAIVVWESTGKPKETKKTHERLMDVAVEVAYYMMDNERTEPSLSSAWEEGL